MSEKRTSGLANRTKKRPVIGCPVDFVRFVLHETERFLDCFIYKRPITERLVRLLITTGRPITGHKRPVFR